jgi:hypothetical protein
MPSYPMHERYSKRALLDTVRVLDDARRSITKVESWTQAAYARSVRNEKLDLDGMLLCRREAPSEIRCRCALGALYCAVDALRGFSKEHVAEVILSEASWELWVKWTGERYPVGAPPQNRIVQINDELGHGHALAMFDLAINDCRRALLHFAKQTSQEVTENEGWTGLSCFHCSPPGCDGTEHVNCNFCGHTGDDYYNKGLWPLYPENMYPTDYPDNPWDRKDGGPKESKMPS